MKTREHNGTLFLALLILTIVIMLLTGCKTTKSVVSTLDQKIDSTEVVKITTQNDITSSKIDSSRVVIIDSTTISIREASKTIEISLDTTANLLLSDILSGNLFLPVKGIKISEKDKETNQQNNKLVDFSKAKSESVVDKSKSDLKKDLDVSKDTKKKDTDKKKTEVDNGVYVVVTVAIALLVLLLYLILKKWRAV